MMEKLFIVPTFGAKTNDSRGTIQERSFENKQADSPDFLPFAVLCTLACVFNALKLSMVL